MIDTYNINIETDQIISVESLPQGIPGISAYQVALNNGFVGTVEEWIDSLKGDSAYDVALSNGFVGSEDEWLESLKTSIEISMSDNGKILTNNGSVVGWQSLENKLNSEDILWDLGEI